jgi:hypothetical protein
VCPDLFLILRRGDSREDLVEATRASLVSARGQLAHRGTKRVFTARPEQRRRELAGLDQVEATGHRREASMVAMRAEALRGTRHLARLHAGEQRRPLARAALRGQQIMNGRREVVVTDGRGRAGRVLGSGPARAAARRRAAGVQR